MKNFIKVFPKDYKKVLFEKRERQISPISSDNKI
jgi:hypothetical protein